jgi:hypothetical protein
MVLKRRQDGFVGKGGHGGGHLHAAGHSVRRLDGQFRSNRKHA